MGLNLPLQRAAIDRLGTPIETFMKLLAVDEEQNTWIMGNPEGDYGPDPNDPQAMQRLDPRGWHCHPGFGCVWRGLV
jgi:hypothetical protein